MILQNLKLLIDCTQVAELEYDYNLFTIRSDAFNLERLEELFNDNEEEAIDDVPSFDKEWTSSKVRILYFIIFQSYFMYFIFLESNFVCRTVGNFCCYN